jgi:SAM-dependent methyltransferase
VPAIDLQSRSFEAEILDDPAVPDHVREVCYRDLARMHRWLGNTGAILSLIRRDPLPVTRVLDIGCGHGALLEEIREKLGVDVVGFDLLPPAGRTRVPILRGDGTREPLPLADVAVSVVMAHHLSAAELSELIRNVGRSCRRFLILDLVRHPAPLALFRAFVAPFVNRINVEDGIKSLERAFTPKELKWIVADALEGTEAIFDLQVAPFFVRQIVDIRYTSPEGPQPF